MSLADEENVQPLLSEQDVETGEDREAPPHAQEGAVNETDEPTPEEPTEPTPDPEPSPEE